MIYIPVTSLDVYHNFGLEYYLMTVKKFTEPVFLLWTTTPTVMLGKYQNAFDQLNLDAVKAQQLTVVRRYSGGGTIYTDQGGCQFTLITPTTNATIDFSSGLELITAALNQIGIAATTDSRNDLVVAGAKVSGSAQYVTPGYKLHHGSLLFASDLAVLAAVLQVDPLKLQAKGVQSVRQRTTNLQAQQPTWTATEFRQRLTAAVLAATHAHTYQLTAADEAQIAVLAAQRFAAPAKIYRQRGAFQYTHKRYITGAGLIQVAYSLAEQRVTALELSGDFFSALDPAVFARAVIGAKFTRAALQPLLAQQLAQTPIVGLDAATLTDLIFQDPAAK
ncbi:lipoate--protein ligase [Loigolactobacillus binensis]|uniref:lipoate--protein ligase n=1 Tax=Loigolactobacillus binensis TaxID=2559922 RepID=A0ABW3E8U0_9LACO|nr:lipoate protein ligase C-terminal domain-containing protein [Loigolactobacillus binensis]